jgi:hypothetical protein
MYKEKAEEAQKVLFERYDPEENEQKLVNIYKNLISH